MKKNIILGVIASAILSANAQFVVPSSTATTLHTYTGGKVGIGNTAALTTPTAQLQLSSTTDNRQIVLNGAAAGVSNQFQMAGFGYNNSILKYQLPSTASDHAFYAATSTTAANELMRVRGNGNVGIGIANPSVKLSLGASNVNTKLAIYENGTNIFGLGTATDQFRFHLAGNPAEKFSFMTSSNGIEIMSLYKIGGARLNLEDPTSNFSLYNSYMNGSNRIFNVDRQGNITSKLNQTLGGYFKIDATGSSQPQFSFEGANSFLSLGLAINNGASCPGCYSDLAVTNDIVMATRTNNSTNNINMIFTNHSYGGSIKFSTKNNPTNPYSDDKKRMEITSTGKVIIGQNSDFMPTGTPTFPDGYKLFVAEGILTPKLKCAVATTSDWSDYVFADNYKLKTLDSVANYIKINKHLPDVPSAQDMVNHGLDVAKTDAILLQKIEELTLYMIELKKQNDKLAAEVASLKK